jgi:hypothetical protein
MGDRFTINIAGYMLTVETERSADHMERLSERGELDIEKQRFEQKSQDLLAVLDNVLK